MKPNDPVASLFSLGTAAPCLLARRCHANAADMDLNYPAFGQALNRTGRPVLYSCSAWVPDMVRAFPDTWMGGGRDESTA